jgi:hypothetical protein
MIYPYESAIIPDDAQAILDKAIAVWAEPPVRRIIQ